MLDSVAKEAEIGELDGDWLVVWVGVIECLVFDDGVPSEIWSLMRECFLVCVAHK